MSFSGDPASGTLAHTSCWGTTAAWHRLRMGPEGERRRVQPDARSAWRRDNREQQLRCGTP